MAYASNVNVLPGDILAVYSGSSSMPQRNNPMVYQLGGENSPIGRALTANGSALTAAAYPIFSPDGKWLVFINNANIQIINLDTGNIATLAASVTASTGTFSSDSSTVVFNTNTSPFIIAVDVATASLKGTISGTYTFVNGTLRGVAYGAHIYLYTTGFNTSGGANMIYQYDPATNSITTWWTMPRAYSIGSVAVSDTADDFMLVCEGVTSNLSRVYAIRPSNVGGPYATIDLGASPGRGSAHSHLFKTASGAYVWMNLWANITLTAPRFYKIASYTTITSTTAENITTSGTAGIASPFISCKTPVGIVWQSSVSGVSNYPIGFVNLYDYTSGTISLSTFNESVSYVAAHPGMARRKFAGHVYDASNAPVSRKIEVIERRTNRVIASGTSSAVDGSFTIPIYTTEQCLVVAKGEGSEISKLADYVTPVAF